MKRKRVKIEMLRRDYRGKIREEERNEILGAVEKLVIDTEYIRLQDALKLSGAAETGGQAKVAVQSGLVKVNGETCLMRGKKLRPGDRAEYAGITVEIAASASPARGEG